ncbi:hypothetical protein LTR01_008974 [Friedmanniomyces endolithicus]|nr:hypothetical protein LTS00_018246 [Friedmanniomyces endolithicus]KAK0302093.1 hypothetical protein LTR01_008974 [Friedmanniomyces endolithicus]
MIVLDAISTETAENARKSLVEQAEGGRAAEPEQTLTQKRNDKPYTILKDTPEVVRACDEFAKKRLQVGPLADLLEISQDEVRRRLKRGKAVHFLPITAGSVEWIHSAPGRIVGILAFSVLHDCPVMRDGGVEHTELQPGQVQYFDGDEPIKWQGQEEGFGLMMQCGKRSSFKVDSSSQAS